MDQVRMGSPSTSEGLSLRRSKTLAHPCHVDVDITLWSLECKNPSSKGASSVYVRDPCPASHNPICLCHTGGVDIAMSAFEDQSNFIATKHPLQAGHDRRSLPLKTHRTYKNVRWARYVARTPQDASGVACKKQDREDAREEGKRGNTNVGFCSVMSLTVRLTCIPRVSGMVMI